MANWRELGEVPDSEDEYGFDSQNIQPSLQPELPVETNTTPPAETDEKDIWEIPSSQENHCPPNSITSPPETLTHSGPRSSLLSSVHSSQDLPSIEELVGERTADQSYQSSKFSLRQSGDYPTPNDDISKAIVHIASSPPEFNGAEVSTPSLPRPQSFREQIPLQSQILGHDAEEQEARQVAIRYERSLRARKPEQMRPYYLEMARFNNAWRKHGLRPVRFINEEEGPRRQRHGSTERDFEPASQDSEPQIPTDESQVPESNEFMEDLLGPEISSSPPRTSPLNTRGGPSSQASSYADTDITSVDGDELPSLQEIAKRGHSRPGTISKTKRKSSPLKSANRKRMKVMDSVDTVSSSGTPRTFIRPPDSPDPLLLPDGPQDGIVEETLPENNTITRILEQPGETTPSCRRPTSSATPAPFVIESDSDVDGLEDDGSGGEGSRPANVPQDGSAAGYDTGSDSESEIVNRNGRRIRGVLPASWLRLDQLSGRNKIQKKINRPQREQSPEREHRRGVAQRRRVDPGSTQNILLFEDTEEEAPSTIRPTTDDIFHIQTRLVLEPTAEAQAPVLLSSDHESSVVEDDHIDRMITGRKRQMKLADAFQGASKRPKTTTQTKVQSSQAAKPPKIMGAFGKANRTWSTATGSSKKQTTKFQASGGTRNGVRATTVTVRSHPRAPQLSILDVIEPDAPRFLKIAARTARSRPDQGRARPNRKNIQLATREDHIDAVSVLKDWKKGSMKQRTSVTAARKARQLHKQTRPLTERSANGSRSTLGTLTAPRGAPRKFTKYLSNGGHATYKAQEPLKKAKNVPQALQSKMGRDGALPSRPAQLEIDNGREMSVAAFHAGKKLLDRLYRTKRGSSTIAGSILSRPSFGRQPSVSKPPRNVSDKLEPGVSSDARPPPQKTRLRKKPKPCRIDIDAPQYSYANDPLPVEYSLPPDALLISHEIEGAKLLGLGPYGTHYTHHFEIFPLPVGVYFHDSTLLGSGPIERALSEDYSQRLGDSRPRVSLNLGEQTLRWGTWNAQVSSEIGIVLDYVADRIENTSPGDGFLNAPTAVAAADYLLSYIENSMTFDVDTASKSYVARITEVVQGLNNRVLSHVNQGNLDQGADSVLGVYDRLALIAFISVRICRSDPTMMTEQFQMEELMKTVASTLIKLLSLVGLGQVRKTYADLNDLRFRERGLRDDASAIHSWVLALRLLAGAEIPRCSFWDLVQESWVPPNVFSSVDMREHERLWEDMFTLLPLVEFNDMGVLVAGRRHQAANVGWGLPQKFLKRVFQLYRENTRQHPSFNNYCRALVGRCHYLVQQWGWRRCSSVVGIIFDFFGSQNLAHLRNEESFESPRFLEALARGPSLEIEPEDRCFHIFLKLVALSIRKLREDNSTRDIRNLITRTVPNHTRQYLKEQKIHERDLAALRNHHDLLCTLCWAAPPDLRPNVGLIERLVVPANSHKEACLINLRAWNQLARFIITTGEATTSFKQFNRWRNNFFQQMMHQYDSVASDIEQQLVGLSKDISSSVSREMVNAMVSMNKAAVMDVLHLSSTASLDVMKHAPDLEAATFALSTLQLQRVFKHFSAAPPELDWAILRASLSTLDEFLSRVDHFKEDEESQQSESQILNSAQADDALLVLNHDLAGSFFLMARCVLSPRSRRDATATAEIDKAACMEQVVDLGARMGMRFINAGVMKLSDMFKAGKHGLFGDVPHKLGLDERRYLTLFVTTLLKHGFDDFGDAGFTLHEVWMLAIAKPRDSLAFENKLAEQLVRHGKEFVPEAVAGLAISPDYSTNRDLFEFGISWMRKSIRDAGPNLKKILVSGHKRTLQLVMDQIKGDLKTVSQDLREHPSYLLFVRDIISLIRAHGPDICTVDEFFYQISREYSPSVQDPQLQVAGMVSYGLRLREGDTRVVHQLFFFLINSFKHAMMNDRTFEEVKMLSQGLQNSGIFSFVLGKMLPAIVRASAVQPTSYVLLDVYVQAFYLLLEDDEAPPELGEDNLAQLRVTLEAMVIGMQQLSEGSNQSDEGLHLIRQFLGFMNMVWPSLYALTLSGVSSDDLDGIKFILRDCRTLTSWTESYMKALMEFPGLDDGTGEGLQIPQQRDPGTMAADPHVSNFTENIIRDVRTNWIVSERRLSIQAPGKARATQSTQSGQGMQRPALNTGELRMDVYGRARAWNRWWDKVFGVPKGAVQMSEGEFPMF
ncbi:hypothetical protein ACO1O0_002437 [Amphichorda felina]